MSISITTLNLGDIPFNLLDDSLFPNPTDILATIVLPPLLQNPFLVHAPRLPTPLCTADFPDTAEDVVPQSKPVRKRPCNKSHGKLPKQRRTAASTVDCCICLESLSPMNTAMLPCQHAFHRLCLFSLVSYPILGSRSMVHCPLCRYALDRHDLHSALGLDVSVNRIRITEPRDVARNATGRGPRTALSKSSEDHGRLVPGEGKCQRAYVASHCAPHPGLYRPQCKPGLGSGLPVT